jgi:hypothetical protein
MSGRKEKPSSKNQVCLYPVVDNLGQNSGPGASVAGASVDLFPLSGSLSGGYYNTHMGAAGEGIVCLGSDSCGPGAAGPKGAH